MNQHEIKPIVALKIFFLIGKYLYFSWSSLKSSFLKTVLWVSVVRTELTMQRQLYFTRTGCR